MIRAAGEALGFPIAASGGVKPGFMCPWLINKLVLQRPVPLPLHKWQALPQPHGICRTILARQFSRNILQRLHTSTVRKFMSQVSRHMMAKLITPFVQEGIQLSIAIQRLSLVQTLESCIPLQSLF